MIVEETRVVVVVDKDTKSIDVLEVLGLLVIAVTDVVHGFRATENIADSVIHWVIEKCGQVVLIRSNIGWVTVEALSHLENSRSFTVLRPKVCWDLWDGINSNTVEVILIDDTLDPVFEITTNIVIALVKIWQVSKSAILYRILIIPVDITRAVIMVALIERVDLTIVSTDRGDMVSDNIDHNPDSFIMGCIDESF